MNRLGMIVFLAGISAGCGAKDTRGGTIWIEGEKPSSSTATKHVWYDSVHKEGMSGGEWISHYGDLAGTASYQFEADRAGSYTFWWRGNTTLARVSYELNDAKPEAIDLREKRGEFMISDKPDHRSLAWVKVGSVPLKQGKNTIRFTFLSEIAHHGGIDCFVFDDTGYVPSGTMKPGTGGGPSTSDDNPAGPDQAIWIEGEASTVRDVEKHSWYDDVQKGGLSGGEWISHYGKRPGTASYRFDVKVADEYTFWLRANPFLSELSYSLNRGKPAEINFAEKRGEYMISDKPDHRFMAWVKVGSLRLKAGSNEIQFQFHGKLENHGGIDCFCLTRIPFVPSGTNKPTSGKGGGGAGDWFPVVYDDDPFSEKSVIDMSKTIEAPAGTHGFLTRSGSDLKFRDSTNPEKFWGCGANLIPGKFTREALARRARYLRKHGVNMIRIHPVEAEIGPLAGGKFDPKKLDDFDFWCSELKKNGIYMTWSVFYGQRIGPNDGYDADLFRELDVVDPATGARSSYGLANVEPKLQDLQWSYLRALMLHKNPYTGLRPLDDPGLAVLEFQNEDCVFFHNPLDGLAQGKKWPNHSKRLRQKWFAWAVAKYKTETAIKSAWGGFLPNDSFVNRDFQLMAAYHLGGDGPLYELAGQAKRTGDFIQFLAEMQKSFYQKREKQIRDLGYKAVTVTTAWRSGGPASDPANLECDAVADMIDRHNYSGGGAGGHSIAPGKINNDSLLKQPGGSILSIGLYQVEDRPFSCTEWTEMPPAAMKVEAAPLFAFYGMGLQGWDASYHFTSSMSRPGDGWPDLSSYSTDTPHYIGQFPALSLAVRKNHVKAAPVAAARRLKPADLFTGTDPLGQDFSGTSIDVKTVKGQQTTPVEVLAIGRVTVGFSGGKPERVDFEKFWDRKAQVVRSMTGELSWDYGRQVVTLAAPKTQAIVGRAGGVTFDLPGVMAKVNTPFVSIVFTSLDDKPLVESGHVLITAMARDTQANAKYSEDGANLLQVGGPPLLMEPVQARLTLKGSRPRQVNVLDIYGVPTGKSANVTSDGSFAIDGTHRTFYYEVIR